MKKTPPEESDIATRTADRGDEPCRRQVPHEILDMIDTALDEQADWLVEWHRAVVCGLPPAEAVISADAPEAGRFGAWFDINRTRGRLDQPVFRQLWADYRAMRETGRSLAVRAAGGERLPAGDYDAFMRTAQKFAATARRIRDAYQRAHYDLDPLTGVHNRRSMMAELERERERSIRTGNLAYVALCDIDGFKSVNDTYGHIAGDSVLAAVAARLVANLRPYDAIYRFGGDEFLVAFAETDREQAAGIAERLRETIAGMTLQLDGATTLSVTASFGLCPLEPATPVETTLRRADAALYKAKGKGRNRVVLWRSATDGDEGRDG